MTKEETEMDLALAERTKAQATYVRARHDRDAASRAYDRAVLRYARAAVARDGSEDEPIPVE